MKLYEYYRSSCSYRLRIALNLKGIEAERIHINLLEGEQKTYEYKKINPQGTVPTLVDGDNTICQSVAAMEYLDETHPESPLLPKDAADRAYVRSIVQLITSGMQPFNNLSVLNYLTDDLGLSEEQKLQWYKHFIDKGFTALEAMLTKSGKYCLGDEITMADICLVPQVYNAKRFDCDMSAFPKITDTADRCEELKEFKDAYPKK